MPVSLNPLPFGYSGIGVTRILQSVPHPGVGASLGYSVEAVTDLSMPQDARETDRSNPPVGSEPETARPTSYDAPRRDERDHPRLKGSARCRFVR